MKNLLYTSAGEINPFGNGAAKRSHQINSFLHVHFNIKNIQSEKYYFYSRKARYLEGFKALSRHKLPLKNLQNISSAGHQATNIKRIAEHNGPDTMCLVWESTLLDHYLKPLLYKDNGYKLIAFPHNIESLVPGQMSPVSEKPTPQWFREELYQFKQCGHVFTISREEEWLLSLYGIPCSWFPYYPADEIVTQLLGIRSFREKNKDDGFFLLLGSYYYKPIRKGINEFLDFIIKAKWDIQVKIAGFGTEELLKQYSRLPQNIQILGSVNNDQLIALQKSCKAIVVNQQASSGMLTKVTEIRIAGIPVIANRPSLRSVDKQPGIYPYFSLQELPEILSGDLDIPHTPDKPEEYYQHAKEIIAGICKRDD